MYRSALDAYSKQGFFASPQVNSKREYHQRFFDWSLVNIVRRTDTSPTQHQIMMCESSVFIIQYLITGGFKNQNVANTNESLKSEFDEAHTFVKEVLGLKSGF